MARRAHVALSAYMDCWEEAYLPQLRLVDVLEGLLAPEEAARIDLLDRGPGELCDPDDVPTATLALLLGAVMLSTDRKVLWAVYGRNADLARHEKYLQLLQLGGQAGTLAAIKEQEGTTLGAAGNLVFAGLELLWREIAPCPLRSSPSSLFRSGSIRSTSPNKRDSACTSARTRTATPL